MTIRAVAFPLTAAGFVFSAVAAAQSAPPPPYFTAPPAGAQGPATGATPNPGAPNTAAPVAAQPTAPVPVETAPAPTPPVGAPAQTPSQNEPTIYVAQPPLPPLMPRARRYHDGFYLRISAGFGGMGVSSSVDNSSQSSTVSGGTWGFDLLLGGTPAPGLVIGGGILGQEIVDASTSHDGAPLPALTRGGNGSVPLYIVGPFIDAFPNPAGGFHFGGLVGLAANGLKDRDDKVSSGLGLSAWAGYMWWASSQWSVGGLVKVTGAWTKREIDSGVDANDTSRAIQLMFSAAYH
jgi:hypothetical protein